MITTGIDVDESVSDAVAVNLSWTYTPSGMGEFPTKLCVRLTSNDRGKSPNLDDGDLHQCMFRQRTHCPGHAEFARGPTYFDHRSDCIVQQHILVGVVAR
jgi:hypothetical protein